MDGSSPTFDQQCSFFEMEETEMGVNFSITSYKEVDMEDDGKKMVVWEPKTSKEVRPRFQFRVFCHLKFEFPVLKLHVVFIL